MNYAESKVFVNHISGLLMFMLPAMMPLREAFKVHTPREFWPCLAEQSAVSAVLLLFVSVCFFFLRSLSKHKSKFIQDDEQAHRVRLEMGRKALLKLLLRLYYLPTGFTFFIYFLGRSSTSQLRLGHYLVAAFVAATLALLAHLASLRYLDRLALDPPPSNAAATEQVRWFFKGNKDNEREASASAFLIIAQHHEFLPHHSHL